VSGSTGADLIVELSVNARGLRGVRAGGFRLPSPFHHNGLQCAQVIRSCDLFVQTAMLLAWLLSASEKRGGAVYLGRVFALWVVGVRLFGSQLP